MDRPGPSRRKQIWSHLCSWVCSLCGLLQWDWCLFPSASCRCFAQCMLMWGYDSSKVCKSWGNKHQIYPPVVGPDVRLAGAPVFIPELYCATHGHPISPITMMQHGRNSVVRAWTGEWWAELPVLLSCHARQGVCQPLTSSYLQRMGISLKRHLTPFKDWAYKQQNMTINQIKRAWRQKGERMWRPKKHLDEEEDGGKRS